MNHSAAVEHLREQIQRNQVIADTIDGLHSGQRRMLDRLQQWQRDRLDATYADLRSDSRYRPACEFFLDELYGGRDVLERDRQLKRVVPVMSRMLPTHLLRAVGDAVQLQAVSLEFDLAMAECMADRVDDGTGLRQPDYAHAYRAQGDWEGREYQLVLIRKLGDLLDETVRRPMVHRLIRMMHAPAVMAGFGALQGFLQRGLDAFAHMRGAEHFLDTIEQREHSALQAMRAGSDWPFSEWIGEGP